MILFYFVITKLCPNLNAFKVTKEKVLYVYVIDHDIPFDIKRLINEEILERMERVVNNTLRFPSLITELCQYSQVPIEENEEKTPWAMPLFLKGLKTKPRKSVRRQPPRDMPGEDSGMKTSDEGGYKVEAGEEEEENEVPTEAEEGSYEIPFLGHQSKLVIENFCDMLYDHHQVVYERMDKKNEWHKTSMIHERLACLSLYAGETQRHCSITSRKRNDALRTTARKWWSRLTTCREVSCSLLEIVYLSYH